MRLFCYALGHRERASLWVKREPNGWRRDVTCSRCGDLLQACVSVSDRKPLDVVQRGPVEPSKFPSVLAGLAIGVSVALCAHATYSLVEGRTRAQEVVEVEQRRDFRAMTGFCHQYRIWAKTALDGVDPMKTRCRDYPEYENPESDWDPLLLKE